MSLENLARLNQLIDKLIKKSINETELQEYRMLCQLLLNDVDTIT